VIGGSIYSKKHDKRRFMIVLFSKRKKILNPGIDSMEIVEIGGVLSKYVNMPGTYQSLSPKPA